MLNSLTPVLIFIVFSAFDTNLSTGPGLEIGSLAIFSHVQCKCSLCIVPVLKIKKYKHKYHLHHKFLRSELLKDGSSFLSLALL